MKNSYLRFLFALVTAAMIAITAGCATIAGGATQEITVNSNPPGADIFSAKLNKDGSIGPHVSLGTQTPGVITLVKRGEWVIILKKEGYKDYTLTPTKAMSPWFIGNVLIGGLIGSSVDSSTGSINVYDPDSVLADLEPE